MGSTPGLGKFPQRRKWQPTPAFLPEGPHRRRSLAGYSPWGHKELDMTDQQQQAKSPICLSWSWTCDWPGQTSQTAHPIDLVPGWEICCEQNVISPLEQASRCTQGSHDSGVTCRKDCPGGRPWHAMWTQSSGIVIVACYHFCLLWGWTAHWLTLIVKLQQSVSRSVVSDSLQSHGQ